jgi:acylphosphatase
MSSPQHQQAKLTISGRVQGVCFRAFAREEALRLGLTGWVRNVGEDKVEALIEGERETLDQFIVWAHKGPPAARVENVFVEWGEAAGEFTTFETRRSQWI